MGRVWGRFKIFKKIMTAFSIIIIIGGLWKIKIKNWMERKRRRGIKLKKNGGGAEKTLTDENLKF